ncbi:tyrosine-type recombinase/integrase [Nocardia sp. NPDC059239]|uniref:tyrosine-type recombinase/integrase n=1 Tax=unclassified Nocardia TaxID=2637762 RepID=UPI0036B8DF4F
MTSTPRKPRRRVGNVRVVDRHWTDYRSRVRTSRWRTDDKGKLVPIGKRWAVQWIDPQLREKSASFDKRGDADTYADRLTSELQQGIYHDPHEIGVTWEQAVATWTASLSSKAKNTRVTHESVLRNHVTPTFAGREVAGIGRNEVVEWVGSLTDKGLSPATVRRCFIALKGVLALQVGHSIRNDPTIGVKLPKLTEPEACFMTAEQVSRLARAADYLNALRNNPKRKGRDRGAELELPTDDNGLPVIPDTTPSPDGLAVRFLAYHGLRFGEFAALRVADIDLTTGWVTVSRSYDEIHSYGPTKSGKSRRVPILPSMRSELTAYLEGRPRDAVAFPGSTGAPLRRNNWAKRVLTPAANLAAIGDHVTPHDLRHTYVSLSAAAVKRPEIVSQFAGHADVAFTLRRYVGLFETDLSAAADLLDAAIKG